MIRRRLLGTALRAESLERDVGVSREIVDRDEVIEHQRRRIDALERESRVKDRFVAVLGHDLRAPLNAILGWTQLMRRERLDAAGRERALVTIERNARSQAALIDELLDVSRMSDGRFGLALSACDVGRSVAHVVDDARSEAERRGIELRTQIAAGAIVAGDRLRIEQIVKNLLSNALRFTGRGGSVDVLVREEGASVRIDVRDTGKGIAPERLPHLFVWLQRGEDAPPTREGLGLGLFVARRLAELHGGSVRATSEGVGHGATFTVLLPSGAGELPAAPRSAPVPARGELAGLDILVVEDDADAVEVLATVLGSRGGNVTSARDASSALAMIAARRPHVLVTDLGLPDMSGQELARRVRREHGAAIAIVALTGSLVNVRGEAEEGGTFDEQLMKPVEIPRLVSTVKQLGGALDARA